jgi:hypothetical protein
MSLMGRLLQVNKAAETTERGGSAPAGSKPGSIIIP